MDRRYRLDDVPKSTRTILDDELEALNGNVQYSPVEKILSIDL